MCASLSSLRQAGSAPLALERSKREGAVSRALSRSPVVPGLASRGTDGCVAGARDDRGESARHRDGTRVTTDVVVSTIAVVVLEAVPRAAVERNGLHEGAEARRAGVEAGTAAERGAGHAGVV